MGAEEGWDLLALLAPWFALGIILGAVDPREKSPPPRISFRLDQTSSSSKSLQSTEACLQCLARWLLLLELLDQSAMEILASCKCLMDMTCFVCWRQEKENSELKILLKFPYASVLLQILKRQDHLTHMNSSKLLQKIKLIEDFNCSPYLICCFTNNSASKFKWKLCDKGFCYEEKILIPWDSFRELRSMKDLKSP